MLTEVYSVEVVGGFLSSDRLFFILLLAHALKNLLTIGKLIAFLPTKMGEEPYLLHISFGFAVMNLPFAFVHTNLVPSCNPRLRLRNPLHNRPRPCPPDCQPRPASHCTQPPQLLKNNTFADNVTSG